MPPLSKKRKASIASSAKARTIRKARRLEQHLQSLPDDEEEQELPSIGDVFAHLMASICGTEAREPKFKYQRGVQKAYSTLWLDRKKQQELQLAATKTIKITKFFAPVSNTSETSHDTSASNTSGTSHATSASNTSETSHATSASNTSEKSHATSASNTSETSHATSASNISVPCTIQSAIEDLKALLRSKRAPIGQNRRRHDIVLFFMELRLNRPEKSERALSLLLADALSRSDKTARQIRIWTESWISTRYIKVGMQGKFSKVSSWLTDEGVLLAIREYITAVGEKLTSHGLVKAINTYLAAEGITGEAEDLENSICERTARIWLNKLGFEWKNIRKGVYIDGHEREDVVAYRQDIFLPQLAAIQSSLRQWDKDGNIVPSCLPEGEREKILVTHDESTFNANDGKRQMWMKNDAQPIRKKGRGKGIMVSEFLTPVGRLAVPPHINADDLPRRQATEYLEYGQDDWWTGEKMVQHVVNIAIPIFERTYPDCQAVFLFDNSSNHAAFAPDALIVTDMNLNPGGKQPRIRNGWFTIAAERHPQSMVFPDDYFDKKLRGQAKGIKQVLQERGLWRNGLRLDCRPKCKLSSGYADCCARQLLRSQPDFQEQKGYLQEAIEAHGHRVFFYPKFHCELNFIEFFWGAAKRYARENCEYSLPALRETIPCALESVSEATIWRYHQKTQRTMQAYRDGCQYGTAEFKDRVYKSHRRRLPRLNDD